MKKFNYELLENRKDQLVQDNSKEDRVYHAPKVTYPSITNLLYHIISKPGIEKWKARVGEEAAQKISTKAARR
jgi:hypothetical protein